MVAETNVRALAPRDDAELLERVLLDGDLAALSPAQRVNYYNRVCDSLHLNPLTKPFDYLKLNGKLTLYPKRDATDQLRKNNGVSVIISSREVIGDVYVVTAKASTINGRSDESTGAVAVASLKGEALANAYMKAETKAKRRVTLSFVGLGWMDESEMDSVRGAQRVEVLDNGEIVDPREPQPTVVEKIDAETTLEDERARAATGGINRAEMEAEYTRLAALAVARNYKDAAKVQKKAAKDLDDDRLVGSVNVLRTWESKLPPAEEEDAAF